MYFYFSSLIEKFSIKDSTFEEQSEGRFERFWKDDEDSMLIFFSCFLR
jgi:hypothetical protein